ncbi:MAG: hypothetical protein ACR2HH_11805 [Chthoniobacterales bacterium]
MPSPLPELELAQITGWMRQAAESAATTVASMNSSATRTTPDAAQLDAELKRAKQALIRARTKSEVKAPQPFRRLRRNQEAVNEGLIDACNTLISVNKKMAAELSALSADVSSLRRHLAQREAASERLARSGAVKPTR